MSRCLLGPRAQTAPKTISRICCLIFQAIVESQSQADPQFRTTRLYTRLSAAEVRATTHRPQGLQASGVAHRADDHHQAQPSGLLSREGRQKPAPKKIPQTDAIFDQVNRIHQAADSAADVLRVSIDAKATVKIGPFRGGSRSRGGGSRRS